MDSTDSDHTSSAATAPNCRSVFGRVPERISPIIGVEFKGNRRQLFSNPMEFPFKTNDLSVVRVEKGEDLGRVICLLERLPEGRSKPEYEVLRRASAKDIKTLEEYRIKEVEAKAICKEKIAKHGLIMKLVDVEYQFDGRKLTFYFTADGRVDFRQLVKDLAATFRTRIELKQIGARDEIRRFGGLGPCGRPLCCAVFIVDFCPITTQMVKDQNLPLNPSKISGSCGRLKCCLRHELDAYQEALKELPRWDTRLETPKGPAIVEKLDVFSRTIFLRYESGDLEKVEASQLQKLLTPGFEHQTAQPPDSGTVEEDSGAILDDEAEDADFPDTAQKKADFRPRKTAKDPAPPEQRKSRGAFYPKKKHANRTDRRKNTNKKNQGS